MECGRAVSNLPGGTMTLNGARNNSRWTARLAVLAALTAVGSVWGLTVSAQNTTTGQAGTQDRFRCGDPQNIGILDSAGATELRTRLNRELSKSGFTRAGEGQRVLVRWYFDLPFTAQAGEVKRGAPVGDTARLTKIIGFSADCNVTNAFSRETRSGQGVTGDYDVVVEFKPNGSSAFTNVGSFFKGAPGSVFARPGIYRLKATPRGKLSPFHLGPITHTIRIGSAGQKRSRAITQLKIKNPGKVVGTGFAIGQKVDPRKPDDTAHCKAYTFSAVARSGKIVTESSSTIQTTDQREAPYAKAIWTLLRGGKVLEEQSGANQFDFDTAKYGDGNYTLTARIDPGDQGAGPDNFQVNPVRHTISVFNCGKKTPVAADDTAPKGSGGADGVAAIADGAEAAPDNDAEAIPINTLDENNRIVQADALQPERFLLKNAPPPPKVLKPDDETCEACKREIARRKALEKKACTPVERMMRALIDDVVLYNTIERDFSQYYDAEVLARIQEFQNPVDEILDEYKQFLDEAVGAGVLVHQVAQFANLLAEDRSIENLARDGVDGRGFGFNEPVPGLKNTVQRRDVRLTLLAGDLGGRLASEVFAFTSEEVAKVDTFKKRFEALRQRYAAALAKAKSLSANFKASPEFKEIAAKIAEFRHRLKKVQDGHKQSQSNLKSIFFARSFEHCLGTPPEEGTSQVIRPDGTHSAEHGIPGMNTVLPDHPERPFGPEMFNVLLDGVASDLRDVKVEGFSGYFPLKFKLNGVKQLEEEKSFIPAALRQIDTRTLRMLDAFGEAISDPEVVLQTFDKVIGGDLAGTFGFRKLDAREKLNPGEIADAIKAAPGAIISSVGTGFQAIGGALYTALVDDGVDPELLDKFNDPKKRLELTTEQCVMIFRQLSAKAKSLEAGLSEGVFLAVDVGTLKAGGLGLKKLVLVLANPKKHSAKVVAFAKQAVAALAKKDDAAARAAARRALRLAIKEAQERASAIDKLNEAIRISSNAEDTARAQSVLAAANSTSRNIIDSNPAVLKAKSEFADAIAEAKTADLNQQVARDELQKAIADLDKAQRAAGAKGFGKVDKSRDPNIDTAAIARLDADPDALAGRGQTADVLFIDKADGGKEVVKLYRKNGFTVNEDGTLSLVDGQTFDRARALEIRDDQIAGADLLKDAGVNFKNVTGQGDVLVKLPNGEEALVPFLKTEAFDPGTTTVADFKAKLKSGEARKLTKAEQLELLRPFHKMVNEGTVIFDTNGGNLVMFPDGKGGIVGGVGETGSVVKLTGEKAAIAAREAQAIKFFKQQDAIFNQVEANFAIKEHGVDLVTEGGIGSDLVIKVDGKPVGVSGIGGRGGLADIIDPELQEAFKDPNAFQKLLNDLDGERLVKQLDEGAPAPKFDPDSPFANLARQVEDKRRAVKTASEDALAKNLVALQKQDVADELTAQRDALIASHIENLNQSNKIAEEILQAERDAIKKQLQQTAAAQDAAPNGGLKPQGGVVADNDNVPAADQAGQNQ